jgi:hypothetical protein
MSNSFIKQQIINKLRDYIKSIMQFYGLKKPITEL